VAILSAKFCGLVGDELMLPRRYRHHMLHCIDAHFRVWHVFSKTPHFTSSTHSWGNVRSNGLARSTNKIATESERDEIVLTELTDIN